MTLELNVVLPGPYSRGRAIIGHGRQTNSRSWSIPSRRAAWLSELITADVIMPGESILNRPPNWQLATGVPVIAIGLLFAADDGESGWMVERSDLEQITITLPATDGRVAVSTMFARLFRRLRTKSR